MSPPTSWDISLSNKTASSLTIDWSGFSFNFVASFFIISLNQTPRAVSQDGNPNEPMNFLSIVVNSSQTVEVVNGLPAFSEFVATVYLVDINNDIYKSNTLVVRTEETGKSLYNFPLYCVMIFSTAANFSVGIGSDMVMVMVMNLYSAFSINIFKCALQARDLWVRTDISIYKRRW